MPLSPEQSLLLFGTHVSTYVDQGHRSHDLLNQLLSQGPCAVCQPPWKATSNELVPASTIKSARNHFGWSAFRNDTVIEKAPVCAFAAAKAFILPAAGFRLVNSI